MLLHFLIGQSGGDFHDEGTKVTFQSGLRIFISFLGNLFGINTIEREIHNARVGDLHWNKPKKVEYTR